MHSGERKERRRIIGIGLMPYAGKYSIANPDDSTHRNYLDSMITFARWLLAHNYNIRLLIGEVSDRSVSDEFKSLLKASVDQYDEERIVDQAIVSADQLLPQIAATEMVVATRFHNVVLALLLNKPVISISFHHKCSSLMEEMDMSDYCQEINHMDAGKLIEQFQQLEKNADILTAVIRQKVERLRKALDEQYSLIFKGV
jgi:polysaccharide pyruvyl transferase WcaK-like protein